MTAETEARPSVPPADFSTFVLSVATAASESLAAVEAARKAGESCAPHVALARHNIELLELLEQKTQSNLTAQEERLLSQLLVDLRIDLLRCAP